MRSTATAGLTPQQLLDRRRAQNKLAQRRFREKARLARATDSSSPSAPSTALPTPSFIPRASSASTAPTSKRSSVRKTKQPSSRSSASFSSESALSPSLSPSTREEHVPSGSFRASNSAVDTYKFTPVESFNVISSSPRQEAANGSTSLLGVDLKELSGSYFVVDQPVLTNPPCSAAPTYIDLFPSSKINDGTGLTSFGMLSDPFLVSQPFPSPSLLATAERFGLSQSNLPATLSCDGAPFTFSTSFPGSATMALSYTSNGAPILAFGEDHSYIDKMGEVVGESASLLPSLERPRYASSSSDTSAAELSGDSCPASPPLSSSHSETSYDHSPSSPEEAAQPQHLDSVRSDAKASCFSTTSSERGICTSLPQRSSFRLELTSMLFVQAVSEMGSKLGLYDAVRDGPPSWQLIKRLNLDAAVLRQHSAHANVEACIPWPSVRSRLANLAVNNPICEQEFALDLLLSILLPAERNSFVVYGDDPFDTEAWEIEESFAAKWWGLFDEPILRRTNWWRRQRGLSDLDLEQRNARSISERQGLGTGAIDDSIHLLTQACPGSFSA